MFHGKDEKPHSLSKFTLRPYYLWSSDLGVNTLTLAIGNREKGLYFILAFWNIGEPQTGLSRLGGKVGLWAYMRDPQWSLVREGTRMLFLPIGTPMELGGLRWIRAETYAYSRAQNSMHCLCTISSTYGTMSVSSICVSSVFENKKPFQCHLKSPFPSLSMLDVVSSAWCCVLVDAAHWRQAPGCFSWWIWNPLSVSWKRQRWHYGASGWTEDKEQGHRKIARNYGLGVSTLISSVKCG